MGEHDDVNWGEDKRVLAPLVRWWQVHTQIMWMEDWDCTFAPSINIFPPGGFWSFTIPWGIKSVQFWKPETREGPKFTTAVYRVVNIRAGWLWIPFLALCHWQGWPWWVWTIGFVLGVFLNWRRDKNSGEYYWTLSFNIDYESQRW